MAIDAKTADQTPPGPAPGLPGARLRHLRKLHGMTMKALARKADLTESYVSKLERDLVTPSLGALHRLCQALDTNISAVFAAQDDHSGAVKVVRAQDRVRMDIAPGQVEEGIALEALIPASASDLLQVNIHIVQPGGGGHPPIQHQGQEFGLVLEGALELTVDGQTTRLDTGDSFSFESVLGHSYCNTGKTQARVLWVNTPPTF